MKSQRKKYKHTGSKHDANKLILATYKAFMLVGIITLRDEFGFGRSRMERFIEKFKDVFDSYERGYISLNDMQELIEKEVGIKILR